MEIDKLRATTGKEYLFKELDKIYLRDKFDQFQRAYFELKRYNIREANKERPKEDNEYEFFVTTKESYYPLLQELSFIRPLRMQSPNMFVGGLESDPLTQNSCPAGWGNITDFGVTVECAGIVGGGVSEGGSVAGTGRWKYAGTETDDAGAIQAVRFAANPDHWDAASGPHAVEELVVVAYPDHDAVKAALLDGELDAVLGAGVLTEADVAELKREHSDQLAVQMTEAIQVRAPPPPPPLPSALT